MYSSEATCGRHRLLHTGVHANIVWDYDTGRLKVDTK